MHHSIELVGVHVRIGNVEVLQDVNVEAKPWEFISIVGANGAGKTTLLKVVDGMIKPFLGRVSVLDQDLSLCKSLSALRRDIAVVAQKPNSVRFPIRVEEAVMMGRYGKVGLLRRPKPNDWEKVYEAMDAVGIRPFAKKLVNELSGGEQQKVALTRALAQDPSILLLDEPTTYLDSSSRSEIMEILYSVHREKGLTSLLVSHDTHLVEQYSDKIYLLEGGKSHLIRSKK
jgi:ABC-type cobalamin/Fe3+-siderophores transport system ATPase subunit